MRLTEEERYQRSKASYERDGWVFEDDNIRFDKICPVIQRACIKKQCLSYIAFTGVDNKGVYYNCYKCSLLNIELE